MKHKTTRLLASSLIVSILLVTSCTQAVTKEEKLAPPTGEETAPIEEKVPPVDEEAEGQEARELEFVGAIEAIDGNIWTMTIEGETITVDVSEVGIDGEPVVGLQVKIKGTVIDNIIVAGEVETSQDEELKTEEPQEIS